MPIITHLEGTVLQPPVVRFRMSNAMYNRCLGNCFTVFVGLQQYNSRTRQIFFTLKSHRLNRPTNNWRVKGWMPDLEDQISYFLTFPFMFYYVLTYQFVYEPIASGISLHLLSMSLPHLSDLKHSTSISKVIGSTPVLIFFFFFFIFYGHYYVSTTTSRVKTLIK